MCLWGHSTMLSPNHSSMGKGSYDATEGISGEHRDDVVEVKGEKGGFDNGGEDGYEGVGEDGGN